MQKGVKLVGAGTEYAYTGTGLTDGQLSGTAHISADMVVNYNQSLTGMQNFLPYGSVQNVLEEKAQTALDQMHESVDEFTTVVVDMMHVVEVAEKAETATTPDEQAEVKEFVAQNQESLVITQEQADTYNQSIDDIETHANTASAYIAVASNAEAVAFLQQGAENNNTTAEQASVSYSANNQWVKMQWANTNNASAVYLNGQSFGLDLYVSEADVLFAGTETEFYQTSPVANYECYMYGECYEH